MSRASEPLTVEQRELAGKYRKFAENLADRRTRSCLPPEDRRQEAYLGLIDAAKGFEPARGLKFETYAQRRVVGAIIDAERRTDTAVVKICRSARQRGVPEIRPVFAESTFVDDERWSDGMKVMALSNIVFVAPGSPPNVEDRDAIQAAMSSLSGNEWYAVEGYFGCATMKEIARDLGLSESRVSQMLSGVLVRLRNHTALAEYAKGA